MTSFALTAGIVAGIISLIAYVPRGLKIIHEKSASGNIWLIWTLSNFLIFLSLYTMGTTTIMWVPFAYFLGSAAMTVLAFTHKSESWMLLHRWLLPIAILSAIRWGFFTNPIVAQGFNIAIYLMSHIMIIKNKLQNKSKETWILSWALYFIGSLINLLAVTNWSPTYAAFPLLVAVMNGIVFSITARNHIRNRNQELSQKIIDDKS